jgi:hypothetical protein
MSIIQIIILVVVLVVWWRIYARWRAGEITPVEFIEWFALWLVVAVVVMVPDVASYLAILVGVGRGSDLIVYLALLLIFYLIFRLFLRFEKIDHEITAVVRHLAIKQVDKNKKENEPNQSVN